MKQKNIIIPIILCSLLLLVISGVNYRHNLIIIPKGDAMVSRHIDFITISTVFVGFSFTALGMLLGLSSENLIEKIKNTCILMDKVGRIICSIVFFIISVAISLLFVLGVNPSNFMSEDKGLLLDGMFYVWCVGCLIVGIFYFIYSVFWFVVYCFVLSLHRRMKICLVYADGLLFRLY